MINETAEYLRDNREEWTCPQCGSHKPPKTHKSREAEGTVVWVECTECDYDNSFCTGP